jgi:hypothetical protein
VESIAAGVITISAASWAPGIWQALEGAVLNVFSAITAGTQRNGDMTITSINVQTRQVTVSGTSAAVVAGDFLYFKGYYGTEMYGLDALTLNTGNLWTINAALYSLWRGQTQTVSNAQLTMAALLKASSTLASRGCKDEVVALVSNDTFGNLVSDQSALRRYNGESTKKGESGFEELCFHGQTGIIKVIADSMTKGGEAFVFAPKYLKRIGSTDITFKRPGRSDDQVWLELPQNAGYEVRSMYSFTLFCHRPAYLLKLTNIVNA